METVLAEKLLSFATVLTRMSAFFLVVPIFGGASIPMTVKAAAMVILSFFFTLINPPVVAAEQAQTIQAILLLGSEAAYGFAMGAIVSVLFSVIKVGGRIMEDQMGLTMAEILDPMTDERGQPIGSILEMVFIIAFLAANGHHLLLKVIHRSFELFPAGKVPTTASLAKNMLEATTMMLTAGLSLAAPILAALLVLLVVLAVIARIVPESDIFFISFPLRIMVGLTVLVMFVPFIDGLVGQIAQLMARLLPL